MSAVAQTHSALWCGPLNALYDSDMKVEHPTPESLWEGGSQTVEDVDENSYRRREEPCRTASSISPNTAPRTSSRWRHDDIPKEKIIDIFQTELAKLREQVWLLPPFRGCRRQILREPSPADPSLPPTSACPPLVGTRRCVRGDRTLACTERLGQRGLV